MASKKSMKRILSITLPLICVVVIIIALYTMGSKQQKTYASIDGFNKFKSTLISALSTAKEAAKSKNTNIDICPIGSSKNSCGKDTDWINGFIIF